MIRNRFILLVLAFLLEACAKIWPYKSDFDCKIPPGEYCQSLYQINKKADRGDYEPKYEEDETDQISCQKLKQTQQGLCKYEGKK